MLIQEGALAEMRSMLHELQSDAPSNQRLDQLLTALAEATPHADQRERLPKRQG